MPNFLLDVKSVLKEIDPSQHTPQSVATKMKADGALYVKTHDKSGFGGQGDLPTPSLQLIC
jgi:hypothetical protein